MAKDPTITSGKQLEDENKAKATTEANVPAVVEAKSTEVDAKFFAPQDMSEMQGMGTENVEAKDKLLPRFTILQSLSPQVNKKKPEYIEGAEVGDFCDVAVSEIFKESVDLIPCYFITQYIEWKPNRGGFVTNHGPSAACIKGLPLNEKRQPTLPDKNIIIETATWYCLLRAGADWRRVFYPMSSTALKVSRKWHTIISAEKLFGPSGPFTPPLFYRPWRLRVVGENNDQGDWFTPVPNKIELETSEIIVKGAGGLFENETVGQRSRNIYHEMRDLGDSAKWLLNECKNFYLDAKDGLAVGALEGADTDLNNGDNARVVGGSSVGDTNTNM